MRRFGALLLSLAALVRAAASFAAPPAPITVEIDLPHGERVLLRQQGDEHGAHWETLDRNPVVRVAGDWRYAVRDGANLRASGLRLGRDPAPISATTKTPATATQPAADTRANPIAQAAGDVPLVVILGFYWDGKRPANCGVCGTTDYAYFRSLAFAEQNSVAHYYRGASRQALRFTPARDTHGTASDGVIGWVWLGDTTPNGVGALSLSKSNRIAADAINAAKHYLDFVSYDSNGDGVVSARELSIVVVLAGYEEAYGVDGNGAALANDGSTPRIWAHSWSFFSQGGVPAPTQTLRGRSVTINTVAGGGTYAIIGERQGDHAATLGVLVHELGHSALGLPDLYDTSGDTPSAGVGAWGVMSMGSWGFTPGQLMGATPTMPEAWTRVSLGWLTPLTMDAQRARLFYAAASDTPTIARVATADAQEYFLIENRFSTGYDAGLTGLIGSFGGLAVWHIDDAVGTPGRNDDNADAAHRRVDMVAARDDARFHSQNYLGSNANLFYAGNPVGEDPLAAIALYRGGSAALGLTNISLAGLSMSADINAPPVIAGLASRHVRLGEAVRFTVGANDPNADAVAISASGVPSGAAFDNASGEFNWPAAGPAGAYRLRVMASDGSASVEQEATIVVEAANDSGGGCTIAGGASATRGGDVTLLALALAALWRVRRYGRNVANGCNAAK